MTTPDLSVLVVSYAFPPVGGAGVQRVLKLVKYLPEHGVTPSVLTVDNPSVPVRDASLERDVPPGTAIVRARTLEPGYALKAQAWQARAEGETRRPAMARARARAATLGRILLVPDPQVLWLPGAAPALARRLVAGPRDDVVFISGPPFSAFLLGALARLRPGTALVLDYRDEWTTTERYEMSSPAAARVNARLERALVAAAHAITTATEAFRRRLCERFPFLDPERVRAIENGFDPEDFPDALPALPRDRFVMTYAGTVFRLTSARALLEAVRRLHAHDPRLARLLDLRFVGRVVETEAGSFAGMDSLGVTQLGYLEHRRVLAELARSHQTLCILDDADGAERIYPAKIFELMRLGRPCLVLAPDGALAELVREHRVGEVIPPRDVAAIERRLAGDLAAFRDGTYVSTAAPTGVERFDRRRQAGEFAEVFRQAATLAQGARIRRESAAFSPPIPGHP